MKSINNIKENENINNEQENELFPVYLKNKINMKEKNKLIKQRKIIEKRLFIIWIFICIISIVFYIKYSLSKINKNKIQDNFIHDDNKEILHISKKYKNNEQNKKNDNNYPTPIEKNKNRYMSNLNEKVGVAFVYETMFGKGIG